jgi:hypothetical protein
MVLSTKIHSCNDKTIPRLFSSMLKHIKLNYVVNNIVDFNKFQVEVQF